MDSPCGRIQGRLACMAEKKKSIWDRVTKAEGIRAFLEQWGLWSYAAFALGAVVTAFWWTVAALQGLPLWLSSLLAIFLFAVLLHICLMLLDAAKWLGWASHPEDKLEADMRQLIGGMIPVSRRLSAEQKRHIADHLRGLDEKPTDFWVAYRSSSDECANYAMDIADALRMSGLKCKCSTYAFSDDLEFHGVVLRLYHPQDEDGIIVSYLKTAFKDVGVSLTISREQDRYAVDHIFVGSPPS